MAEQGSSAGEFLVGFVIGGLLGAAVALIMAPQSGEQTMAQIREKGIELKGKAQDLSGQAQARAGELANQAKDRASDIASQAKDKASQLGDQAKGAVSNLPLPGNAGSADNLKTSQDAAGGF